MTNKADNRLRILTWNTPPEGWSGRCLRVTREGVDIPCQGPQVKRGAPAADGYVSVGPGRTARATVDVVAQ